MFDLSSCIWLHTIRVNNYTSGINIGREYHIAEFGMSWLVWVFSASSKQQKFHPNRVKFHSCFQEVNKKLPSTASRVDTLFVVSRQESRMVRRSHCSLNSFEALNLQEVISSIHALWERLMVISFIVFMASQPGKPESHCATQFIQRPLF